MKKIIYLDNSATTPVTKQVAEQVSKIMTLDFGNPSSQHQLGKTIHNQIENAREKIAEFINADKSEIYFTSGGTESNNLAIKGLAESFPEKKHIITSIIEHPAILNVCKFLENKGYKIDYIPVNSDGLVNPKQIESKITNKTLLVTIMHVNNEIGTIQPIEEIAKICKLNNVFFHTDAVQSFAKLPIDVKKMQIDLMSVSGHKINAPKGIGFLYIKKTIKISPLLQGGGQEKAMRSGTENTSGIIGLSKALEISREQEEVRKSRDKLLSELLKIPGSRLNGSKEKRIYNNINVSFYGIEGESLMLMLDKEGIYVSTGSACSSHKLEESHVLKAISVPPLYIHGSIRLTLDTINKLTDKEISFIAKKINEKVEKLREISPFKLEDERFAPRKSLLKIGGANFEDKK